MTKRRSDMDWEADPPFMPDLTVYERGRGLKDPIGYVRFDPPRRKTTKKPKPKAKKNARR